MWRGPIRVRILKHLRRRAGKGCPKSRLMAVTQKPRLLRIRPTMACRTAQSLIPDIPAQKKTPAGESGFSRSLTWGSQAKGWYVSLCGLASGGAGLVRQPSRKRREARAPSYVA